jgi:hypothetical protein
MRNERMRCARPLSLFLAIAAVIFFAAHAVARERPVFCNPPNITVVARGAIVGGRLWPMGLFLRPLVLPPMLDAADRAAVVRVDDVQAPFPAAAARPVISRC